MFTQVSVAIVYVTDQDAAKDFYLNTLGFVLRQDRPMYPGAPNRWLTVAPSADAYTEILLDVALDIGGEDRGYQRATIGKSQPVILHATNLPALVDELKAKGVVFTRDLITQWFGSMATFADQDGNQILIVEPTPDADGRNAGG